MTVHAPVRPVDAASVLVLDRSSGRTRVLVGRRSTAHVFMPDVYVFPGGRRDRFDSLVPVTGHLHPAAAECLMKRTGRRVGDATLRGIAVAALRELHEEAGLVVGRNAIGAARLPFRPDLSHLRYFARAITPPGNVRRYDTRFFAFFADEAAVDTAAIRDSHELHDLRWIDICHDPGIEMPDITVMVLEELKKCLQEDASLPFDRPATFFHTRRGRLVRDIL